VNVVAGTFGKPGKRLVVARAAALELATLTRLLALAFHRALEPSRSSASLRSSTMSSMKSRGSP